MSVPVSTYAEFAGPRPLAARLRQMVRDAAVCALGLAGRNGAGQWVRFPYYHHVYDDERRGFEAQLAWLRTRGEFLTLDDAVGLLQSGQPIDGRYFCLSFDDGLGGCRNAVSILAERNLPATIYVATAMMGKSFAPDDPVARTVFGYRGHSGDLDFLGWEECRSALGAGISIGSHTCGHVALAGLDDRTALAELVASKQAVESALAVPCRHFCAPFGMPGRHYKPERDPSLAAQAGYVSFATGLRGPNYRGTDPFALKRDHLLANWSPLQLRYFMSRP